MIEKLKVISVKYFETRKGLGYECKTNVKGLSIWNDGVGGSTYISINEDARVDTGHILSQQQLESLIDEYENS